ncbi:hypothetical protein ACV0BM_004885 [Elizabethkingia meningoseptica]
MKFNILSIVFPIILMNCTKQKVQKDQWQNYSVDKNFVHNKIFKQLESENEIQMLIDSEPPTTKKTTRIFYDNSDQYVCNPMFWENTDTLAIHIAYYTGFTSSGFSIRVHKNKYEIFPFSSDDVISNDEKPSVFKNSIQKLILNKSEYKPNDSIYGYVEFNKTEYDQYGNIIPHKGKGYFRGKIVHYK